MSSTTSMTPRRAPTKRGISGSLLPDAVIFLGTDGTERWTLEAFHAFARPYFAKHKAWAFHATRRSIDVAEGGRFAYFDEDLATEKLGPARGSRGPRPPSGRVEDRAIQPDDGDPE